jgi:TolB-like protein/class 3 adenylate cyclase/Tfp pilus assembly protein PilF
MAVIRRLTAILAADVVGYSRLMGADEEGTHERLMEHRVVLLEPKIEEHRGRVVKTTGDGVLAEFPSVVEAVLCAVEFQCGMSRRNLEMAADAQIAFRIGVNIGDVIAEPEDIFGDGVNIAARLEGLAEPNGICISQIVYDQIRDRLPFAFEDRGRHQVKNIARPLHVFALGASAIAALSRAEPPSRPEPPVLPVSGLPGRAGLAPRLSIVVLPFTNLNPDPTQQYFADAITDDLTTDLSRIPGLFVISINTALSLRDRSNDARRIGHQLNVRYVLQGSIRRAGNRVRVNTQLIDAETNAQVWTERFDCDADDVLNLQDEITSQIAVALDLELIGAEAARVFSDNPDALDFTLRGRAALYNWSTRQNFDTAVEMFETAMKLDPASAEIQSLLAATLSERVLEQLSHAPDLDLQRAEDLVNDVLTSSPRHPRGHFARGHILRARHEYKAAVLEYETAVASNRNWVVALAALGLTRFLSGSMDDAIAAQERAIRLSPRDPRLPNWYWRIGMVHLLSARLDEAAHWLERARSANSNLPGPHAWLAAAYALQERDEAAQRELAEARRLSGDTRYASILRFRSTQSWAPEIQALADNTFFAGLRRAGMPEA